jgi:hypothetical protein
LPIGEVIEILHIELLGIKTIQIDESQLNGFDNENCQLISMSDIPRTSSDVFQFTQDEQDFCFSEQFNARLRASNSPYIILLLGDARTGKSTRGNQLLAHEPKSRKPFKAEMGLVPITRGFQYVGPLKFRDLETIHHIRLQVPSDPDIFVIDCEGLHSLVEATPTLKKAMFSLSQLASMTVLVQNKQ